MIKYRVGQVLYVVLKKEMRVYPMQVIEEITKKTLDGVETSYVVRGGTDPKAQLLITEVDGEIFDSAERAKSVLTDRATASIAKLVETASQKAKEWYPGSFEAPSDALTALKKQPSAKADASAHSNGETDGEESMITLPDGTTARVKSVKLPDVLS